jgi:hypothetical protein
VKNAGVAMRPVSIFAQSLDRDPRRGGDLGHAPRPACFSQQRAVRSTDGSRAAHVEHTVAITEDGPVVLTEPAGQR